MKQTILFLSIGLLLSTPAMTSQNCFLAMEDHQVIGSEGDCKSRHAPCSTFKIAISLMGYNEGLLTDETHPELPFKDGYADYIENWKQSYNPRLWMKNSCVWYSQILTSKFGIRKFEEYVTKFNYGNQDISGDKGKDNGLTHSWLSSSLEISPEEQIVFLQNLLDNKLPVSLKSQEMTRNLLFIEELADGWKLYGKTGSGSLLNEDRTQKLDRQIGWFIGWIQNSHRTIIFANFIEDEDKQDTYAGPRARADAKEKLMQIIQENNSKDTNTSK
jgi:beta-lactamase class D